MISLETLQKAIVDEQLDGWLFFHFRGRDPVTIRVLGLPHGAMNTRPAYYLVPARGEPRKIVHTIEPAVFDDLPGTRAVYASRAELLQLLEALPRGTYGVQMSQELPIVSFMDFGTAKTLERIGLRLTSSASLIQRTVGVLDADGIASHERAAKHLYEIVTIVWSGIREQLAAGRTLREGDVQGWITKELSERGLYADHPAIVAAGPNAADPHFDPGHGGGAALERGKVLQLDLWAKETTPTAIYADISWVGVLAPKPDAEVARRFAVLASARDRGFALIDGRLRAGAPVNGAEVDEAVRAVLIDAGMTEALRHRTGHGIDVETHGSGVNLDSIEFPDRRNIIEGSCFSIEPGVYFDAYGLRTEIDVYVSGGRPIISGGKPQERLLDLS